MSEFDKYERREQGSGRGWLIATLVILAFIGGAFISQYLPVLRGASAAAGSTAPGESPALAATPQPSAATAAPAPTDSREQQPANYAPLFDGASLPDVVDAVQPAVVGVHSIVESGRGGYYGMPTESTATGSGVIVSADGYILTNNHVIAGARSIIIVMHDGTEVEAELIGGDEQTDLAVLKIEKEGLTTIKYGDSDAVRVGEGVLAIGNPLGQELAGSVTFGIISATNREIMVDDYKFSLLQTDAAINPGNSGGALVNTRGELIGINSLKSTFAGYNSGIPISAEGIGFAIPINTALPIMQELIATGYVDRPVLGISGQEISARQSQYYNVPQGILVMDVTRGSSAEKVGIREQDIITAINGEPITTVQQFRAQLAELVIGDEITVTVYRDGKSLDIVVKLYGRSTIVDN